MKKINKPPFLQLQLAALLVLISTADAVAALSSNATGIGIYSGYGMEEFLMEPETSRRALAGNRPPTITYQVAGSSTKTHCNRDVYSSCISGPNKFYNNRPCDLHNSCNRPGH